MKHFTTEEWIDFANAAVAGSKRHQMERHLEEGCPRCKKLMPLWEKNRFMAEPPNHWCPPMPSSRDQNSLPHHTSVCRGGKKIGWAALKGPKSVVSGKSVVLGVHRI